MVESHTTEIVDSASQRRFFHTLDLMRGIAAIAVVILHLGVYVSDQLMKSAYLAVDLFFILSGVVIDNAYRRRLERGLPVAAFMAIRIIRLYPLYVVGLLIGGSVAAFSLMRPDSQWSAPLLACAMVLGGLFVPMLAISPSAFAFPVNAPSWSLFFELLINVAYAALQRFLGTTVLVVVCALSGAAVFGVAVANEGLDVGATVSDLHLAFPRVIFGFTAGVLIARLRAGASGRPHGLEVALLCLILLAAFAGPPTQMRHAHAAWDILCALVVFPLVIHRGLVAECPAAMQRTATFLGLTSYAVYVLHVPLMGVFVRPINRATDGFITRSAPWSGLAIVVVFVGLAWAADRWLDAPLRRWLTRRRTSLARRDGAYPLPLG